MQVENWTDLRFLLALHRGGTLTAAARARALGLDQTTVTRRLRALEQAVGAELYERLRGGAVFTQLGSELVVTAERLEKEMLDLDVRLLGGQSSMVGPVRITMPPYFAVELIEECREFVREFPGIELELVATDELHNISKREADIALRVASKLKIPDHLVGRKIAPCALSIFGTRELQDLPWEECPWVGFMETFGEDSVIDKFRRRYGAGPWGLRTNSSMAIVEAARAGIGVTPMACGCPRVSRDLVALTEPEFYGDIWVLTHPELKRSPRIRAALDFWYAVMERRGPAFAGES